MDFPVSWQVVYLLIARDNHFAIKIHNACLASGTIIEKDAILVRINKATNIHFPGIIRERVLLLLVNAKIFFEIQYEDVRRASLRPLWYAATQIISRLWDCVNGCMLYIQIRTRRVGRCWTRFCRRTRCGTWAWSRCRLRCCRRTWAGCRLCSRTWRCC